MTGRGRRYTPLAELANHIDTDLHGVAEGGLDARCAGIGSLAEARADQLAFLSASRLRERPAGSAAVGRSLSARSL